MNNESGRESQLGGVVTWNMKRELRMRRAVQIDDVKTMKQAIISPYNEEMFNTLNRVVMNKCSIHLIVL